MYVNSKKPPAVAAAGDKRTRRLGSRQLYNAIIAHSMRFCILIFGICALCGLGALFEEGHWCGLVLAASSIWAGRQVARLLPDTGKPRRIAGRCEKTERVDI